MEGKRDGGVDGRDGRDGRDEASGGMILHEVGGGYGDGHRYVFSTWHDESTDLICLLAGLESMCLLSSRVT